MKKFFCLLVFVVIFSGLFTPGYSNAGWADRDPNCTYWWPSSPYHYIANAWSTTLTAIRRFNLNPDGTYNCELVTTKNYSFWKMNTPYVIYWDRSTDSWGKIIAHCGVGSKGYMYRYYTCDMYSCDWDNAPYEDFIAESGVQILPYDQKTPPPCVSCDVSILNFAPTDDPVEFNMGAGNRLPISADFDSNVQVDNIKWTLSVNGIVIDEVTGPPSSYSYTWNGKIGSEQLSAGTHTGVLKVENTSDSACNESKTFTIIVKETEACNLNVLYGSTANVASGNIADKQHLFSLPSTGPNINVSLNYNSQDSFNSILGKGWNISIASELYEQSNGDVVIEEGTNASRYYTFLGGSYQSQTGDYSSLTKNGDNTYTITEKNGTQYNFDIDGKLSSIIDRNGNTQTFQYTNGLLTTVTDSVGRITTFNYDLNNHLSSIVDPAGNTYLFDVTGNTLNSITNPDGGQWLYTYDANGLILTKTDPAGNMTAYTYDSEGRTLTSVDPEGRTRSITYPTEDGDVKTSYFTDKDGSVMQLTYEVQTGNLVRKQDPQGGSYANTYDANNNLLTETDAAGRTTTYTYDANGNRISVTNPLGQTTT
jgi:YD repeat-containing protein